MRAAEKYLNRATGRMDLMREVVRVKTGMIIENPRKLNKVYQEVMRDAGISGKNSKKHGK